MANKEQRTKNKEQNYALRIFDDNNNVAAIRYYKHLKNAKQYANYIYHDYDIYDNKTGEVLVTMRPMNNNK